MSARLGIIGHPVAHSLSPAIQGAALRAAAVDATYDRWDTPPDDLPARIAALREPDCLGANVTLPHKQAVLPLLDEVAPLAAEIGAVNSLVNDGGRLTCHNTDCGGFVVAVNWLAEPVWVRRIIAGRLVRPWTNGTSIEDANTGIVLRTYGGADIINATRRQPTGSAS